MGSPLDRLIAEHTAPPDSTAADDQSPLDALAAKYGAKRPQPAAKGPLDALTAKYSHALAVAGLSQVATPEEAESAAAADAPRLATPAGIPPMQADATAARPGPAVGEPPAALRVPAELVAGTVEPFVDVLVRPTTEDIARRGTPSMARAGVLGKAGINIGNPTPEQAASVYGALAPQSRAELLLHGAQAAALLAAGPAEAAAKDVLEAGAARLLGTEAVEGVLNQAALHGAAGATVNAGLGALFDPEHPARGAAIGAGAGLVLGGIGGAAAAKAAATHAAAETADQAVLGTTLVEGMPGADVLDAAQAPAAPTPTPVVATARGVTTPVETLTPEVAPAEPQVSAHGDAALTPAEPLVPHEPAAAPTPDAAARLAPADRVVKDRGAPPAEAASEAEGLAPGTPDQAAQQVNRYTDALRRTFNPTARSAEANATGLIIRARAGERALMDERAHAALRQFAKTFDRMPDAERLDVIDRIETGQAQATPELEHAAATMRSLLDGARDAIRALGTGKLEHFVQDYFPHIWANPEEAQRVIARLMSKRSLTGPGSFLKRRTIPTLREGMDAGLVPVTTNPVDLVLLRLREANRYIMGQRIIAEMKAEGLARFISATQQAPAGYVQISDKVGTVYGSPNVTISEAYDKLIKERLEQIVQRLNITHVRKPKIGRAGVLGFAEGGSKITTRAGTPLDVVYHELGHAIDFRYGLWDALTRSGAPAERAAIQKELRALADLRYEGQEASASFKRYVRNRNEKMAVSLQALLYAPDRMAEVAPTVKAKLTAFIDARPELRDLLDIRPSLVHGATTYE
ncbi:MAG TPA: hypothetical protein VFK09_03015, partial [Gemmatimonadales bacterium]|nr:hypothetical protein [Gemmatimonadales bacterium]